MSFDLASVPDKKMFLGEIVSQGFSYTKAGVLQLVLECRLLDALHENYRPEKGTEPVPGGPLVVARFMFDEDRPDSLTGNVKTLSEIHPDLADGDITRLDPTSDDPVSLQGKRVFVQKNGDFWNVRADRSKKGLSRSDRDKFTKTASVLKALVAAAQVADASDAF